MIRVGLDIRATQPGFRAHFGRGTGRYTAELAARLVGRSEGGIEVGAMLPEQLLGMRFEEQLLKLLPLGKQTLHTQVVLPRILGRLPFDALHFPHHGDTTARCPIPFCVTVLDLIPIRFPDLYKPKRASWRFHLARKLELDTIRAASGIFAISEATKKDVVDLLGIAPERIVVTPLGVDEKFKLRAPSWRVDGQAVRSKFSLPNDRPLLFYFGGIDPRKNVPFLLEVLRAYKTKNLGKSALPLLILAGAYEKDERFPDLKKKIAALDLNEDTRLLGYVSEDDLLSLLAATDVLAFPSLYEGFGLPVLEAMACGVPVLAGGNSSLFEVMGEDYPLCRDGDVDDWLKKLEWVLSNEPERSRLAQCGLKRAKLFTWDRTAELTLGGLRQFLPPAQAGKTAKRVGQ